MTPKLPAGALGDHLDRLFRAAWALCGSREDAEDLVQETYVRVLAKPRTIGAADEALPYLLGVLRNTYVSGVRTRSRRPQTVPIETSEHRLSAPRGESPPAALEARELFAVIAALPAEQRDVIVAVDVAGLSYAEAAHGLDVPIGTVMSRLYRGRDAVARAITT